jgi:hypothetical protein
MLLTHAISKIRIDILYLISLYELIIINMGFVRGSHRSVLLVFSQSYVEYDLRKNKIVALFFCQPINFYELIIWF